MITARTMRNHHNALNPRITELTYPNNILAKVTAARAGCHAANILNANTEVAECTGENIFVVKHGKLRTRPISAGILEGGTRSAVIALARAADIPVEEITLTRHDVYSAD